MSAILTENIVLSRTRSQDLRNVRKLNCWGSELKDVSIVKRLTNVEVLSLSLNNIDSLEDFGSCKYLQELYLRKNRISNINELVFLQDLPYLRKLWLAENPCAERANYRMTVLRALPYLEMLDNVAVGPEEVAKAQTAGDALSCLTEQSERAAPGGELQTRSDLLDDDGAEEQLDEEEEEEEEVVVQEFYQEREVKPAEAKVNERPVSLHSPIHQTVVKNQRYSYPDVGQQWNPARESTPRTNGSSVSSMLRSVSINDYSPYNGSSSTSQQPVSPPYQSGSQAKLTGDSGYETCVNSGFGHDNHATNGHFNKSSTSENGHKASSGRQQRLLSKGGKNRSLSSKNANILSAVLCLIKELDYASLEVVETAIHCRMEEMED